MDHYLTTGPTYRLNRGALLRALSYRPCRGIRGGVLNPIVKLRVPTLSGSLGPNAVSIIIPVHNQSAFTDQCLHSVLWMTEERSYEIIVVDNASTDDTATVLRKYPGVRVIRSEENLGFGEACNLGASRSRCSFLLFLNNDTIVHDLWLSSLMKQLLSDPSIAAVGAKLISPDGNLQEAGSIVWNDGSAMNFGSGQCEDRYEFNYAREVDYCSGACLLVRKVVFESAGGFDPRFSPGYYEDVDLCFELRKLGYRIFYCPHSRVTHFGGGSFKTLHKESLMQRNLGRLREKQAFSLQKQPSPGTSLFVARDRKRAKNVLVIDHSIPCHDQDAGSLRMFHCLKILKSLNWRVTFLSDTLTPIQPYTHELQEMGIEVVYGSFLSSYYLEQVAKGFQLVLISRLHVAQRFLPQVRRLAQEAKIIFDTVDLHHIRELRRVQLEGTQHELPYVSVLKLLELQMSEQSDSVWVTTPVEKERLLSENPSLPVAVVPTIHSVRSDEVRAFSDRGDLLFVGGFNHPPNEDAIIHFIQEIFPEIYRRIGVRLFVAGSNPTEKMLSLQSESVIVTGYQKDLTPFYDRCRVFVAPLRYGAGIKGKIGESLAHGLPVVTTPIGAEGMGLIDRENIRIADTPKKFSETVVELYNDPNQWLRLSEGGREHVRRFDPVSVSEAIRLDIDRLFGSL